MTLLETLQALDAGTLNREQATLEIMKLGEPREGAEQLVALHLGEDADDVID